MTESTGWGAAFLALVAIVAPLALAWVLIGFGVRRKAARLRPGAHRRR